ncbi:9312_t:CDS:2 [Acaulospora colombiana]|uniref:9312_t:CDS:1 n=1 Tax=Acaulospora colombiana TaxID=27376 RepID=A0ACA9K832_9GLOM|nr:9312_t:CDS:2 [Acaulospora colombiana]
MTTSEISSTSPKNSPLNVLHHSPSSMRDLNSNDSLTPYLSYGDGDKKNLSEKQTITDFSRSSENISINDSGHKSKDSIMTPTPTQYFDSKLVKVPQTPQRLFTNLRSSRETRFPTNKRRDSDPEYTFRHHKRPHQRKRASDTYAFPSRNNNSNQPRTYDYYFDSGGNVRRSLGDYEYTGGNVVGDNFGGNSNDSNHYIIENMVDNEGNISRELGEGSGSGFEGESIDNLLRRYSTNTTVTSNTNVSLVSPTFSTSLSVTPLSPSTTLSSPIFPKSLSPTTEITPIITTLSSDVTYTTPPILNSPTKHKSPLSSLVSNLRSPKYFRRQSDSLSLRSKRQDKGKRRSDDDDNSLDTDLSGPSIAKGVVYLDDTVDEEDEIRLDKMKYLAFSNDDDINSTNSRNQNIASRSFLRGHKNSGSISNAGATSFRGVTKSITSGLATRSTSSLYPHLRYSFHQRSFSSGMNDDVSRRRSNTLSSASISTPPEPKSIQDLKHQTHQKSSSSPENILSGLYQEDFNYDAGTGGRDRTVSEEIGVDDLKWKPHEKHVALKRLKTDLPELDEMSLKEFIREARLLNKVLYHPNLNEFYGVTRDPEGQIYTLVLQYANNGNLRDYLASHKDSLKWEDKRRMSLDIAEGICYLHSEGIIHRDLVITLKFINYPVHDDRMMIADFGLSKSLDENPVTSSNSGLRGMAGYIDPQCYIKHGFKRDKKSDIFSYGVILWEISSCRVPIPYYPFDPVEGTPVSFYKLYKRCQNKNPNERPEIEEVVHILKDLDIELIIPILDISSNESLEKSRYSIGSHLTDSISIPQGSYLVLDTNQETIQVNKLHTLQGQRSVAKEFFRTGNFVNALELWETV